MRSSSRFSVRAALAATVLLVAGCSFGSSGITISDAWARPSLGPAEPTAAYLTITNTSGQADRLVSASSPAAGAVGIHQTTTDASGMTGMHLMVTGLKAPLKVGDTLELHLVFQHAGTIVVSAAVRQG